MSEWMKGCLHSSFRHRKNIIRVGKLSTNILNVGMSHICFTMFLISIKNIPKQAPTTQWRRKHGKTCPNTKFHQMAKLGKNVWLTEKRTLTKHPRNVWQDVFLVSPKLYSVKQLHIK